ncbi:MAG TPA: IS1634 family transposase [Nocardioidaceae bacterium]|nr:IS1634 family transposase [Nocardioidaceae bacterium]
MASLYPKKVNGKTYWYLREMARVAGKPRMVSERYLGSAADLAAAVGATGEAARPARTRHLAFGDVAAVWATMARLDVVGVIDEVTGGKVPGAGASVGTYLALAALNRVVDPCSKRGFAQWWTTTAGDRFTRIGATALDHRRFWDAMHAVTADQLGVIEARITAAMIEEFDLDTSALALDMTNFATYLDTGNDKAPIAQRGKAKQKRADLRLVGLGLVVTRDGGIPLVSHAYAGNRPDVTQFASVIDKLTGGYRSLLTQYATAHTATRTGSAEVTVVFDAGQNSEPNFAHLVESGLHYVGSAPPSDHADLLALTSSARKPVDPERFGDLSALETRRTIYGRDQRVILTHSPTLHHKQARGLDQTLAKAGARLDDLAATLARGKTRRGRGQVETEITSICANTWAKRVITWELTGDTPAKHRLTWRIDTAARKELETEIFGKRILITDHDDWPVADVVAGYRSQCDAEFSFRQLKDPHVVSFSPMHHWTDHNIRVHTYTCVLALQIAHLMRRQAEHAGLHFSVRALLADLAGIEETVLIYPSTGGRPKARRMLTETSTQQNKLIDILGLQPLAPPT